MDRIISSRKGVGLRGRMQGDIYRLRGMWSNFRGELRELTLRLFDVVIDFNGVRRSSPQEVLLPAAGLHAHSTVNHYGLPCHEGGFVGG